MRFHREAFVEILERSGYQSNAAFARAVGISAGALHDIVTPDPVTGRTRRQPSPELIKRFAAELKCPLPAIIADPERVAC